MNSPTALKEIRSTEIPVEDSSLARLTDTFSAPPDLKDGITIVTEFTSK